MKHVWTVVALALALAVLAACGSGQTAAPAAKPAAQATQAPAAQPTQAAAAKPAAQATEAPKTGGTGAKIKVGLVTDQGGVNDKSFNQSAWAGVQKAIKDLGIEGKFIESKAETDYEKNLDIFANEKYDLILGVGFLMGDALAKKAKQYPDRKFAIVDNAYFPAKAGDPDPYATDLKNVTSLMFQEDEVGYLAGVLAGCMTKTGTVCTVSGMEIPPVVRYVVGYQNGAKSQNPQIKALNTYIPSFVDSAKGKETGLAMIGQSCDVVFGVGGITGNGGLLAAQENGKMAIGVDVDQYQTYPEVKAALITSAMKNVDVAVFEAIKSAQTGSLKAGILTFNVKNGGIGLAPYHDWESKIDQKCKDAVAKATEGLKNGTIQTGYKP
ncbi:MAG: BMP family ABC transporter substrate-binding protein [Anaerolineae bacterium]|nr:BMP family ABC transporter substrate-binding protein [Anaerolineae bacterium]